jgi:glycosyltransferase involved in cell wall biosynthesis
VRSAYLGSDALVLTSRWEGFPNALLEALGHGRPVVSTDVGDAHKLAVPGSTGWLVPAGDIEALAAALSSVATAPPEVLGEMGRRGASLVSEQYSDRRLAERTLAVYREVLE